MLVESLQTVEVVEMSEDRPVARSHVPGLIAGGAFRWHVVV